MKRILGLVIVLLFWVSLCNALSDTRITFFDGTVKLAPMLWVNDSLLYVWNGPETINLADEQFCKAFYLKDIAQLRISSGKSYFTCFKELSYVTFPAVAAFIIVDAEDFDPSFLFGAIIISSVANLVLSPFSYFIQSIPQYIDRPVEIPGAYLMEKYGKHFYIKQDATADIARLESIAKP